MLVSLYFLAQFCERQTDGFTLEKIHAQIPSDPRWEVEIKEKIPLKEIFSQRFTYLSSGGQSVVFVSEDQKYVIKCIRQYLTSFHFFLDKLPLPPFLAAKREKQKQRRLRKYARDYQSYKLAYEQLFDETALLYLHLNQTDSLGIQAKIVDKLHIEHQINLDTTHFILQKKGDLALPHLLELIQQQKMEEAKQAITSICDLIRTRCQKGIYDEDGKIHRNFGFLGPKAILIDVGRLKQNEQMKKKEVEAQELEKITARLKQYLEEKAPELVEHLNSCTKI